jgi:hypothetical protein
MLVVVRTYRRSNLNLVNLVNLGLNLSTRRPGVGVIGNILVGSGDFGQTPGPTLLVRYYSEGVGVGAAAFLCHYYFLRT